MAFESALKRAASGARLASSDALTLATIGDLQALLSAARARRDAHFGSLVSYSPKVFIPLTRLCRDVCRYCTFAHTPKPHLKPYLALDEVLEIAEQGVRAGCHEALFTLGDQPEARYRAAREALAGMGYESTLDYVIATAKAVLDETGLLPHINAGVLDESQWRRVREISVSSGLMLESTAERLCERGGPHHGCPDKAPAVRVASIEAAGRAAVPFTSGVLIGIGETRIERIEALLALRDINDAYGHIQEVIVQNFRAKPGTAMADAREPSLEEHLWSIAVARLILDPNVSVQAPPNLNPSALGQLLDAGINDWGGVSPVTPDHVNPEAPWPLVETLRESSGAGGKTLIPRLGIYPRYAIDPERWLSESLRSAVLRHRDTQGFAREDQWLAGITPLPPNVYRTPERCDAHVENAIERATNGAALTTDEVSCLFAARGASLQRVIEAADALRQQRNGDVVSFVVNRNINYTNLCYFGCRFCAFSKGKRHADLRGAPYDLSANEIARRVAEAWQRGATEVCLQGGIHPDYTGQTYLDILRTVKEAAPEIHVHAFSPLEIWQGAQTLGIQLEPYLKTLRDAGLGSLPGTAAEVLDDRIRRVLCPDKIVSQQWLQVMEVAHGLGIPSTATIMFGHVDDYTSWAHHLLAVRDLAARGGGFTEFVPLPFVHTEAPIYRQGRARRGPTYREALLMHAVARLVLDPHVPHIQASWVKMGPQGAAECLAAGADDLGGTLMNESITRAAGASFGEEFPSAQMEATIAAARRTPRQRTTLYRDVTQERRQSAREASALLPTNNDPPARRARSRRSIPIRYGLG